MTHSEPPGRSQRSAAANQLLTVLRLLVDRAEEVRVEEFTGRSSTLFEAAVAPSDLGKVIGRQGRTIDSLRALLAARAAALGERYELEILED